MTKKKERSLWKTSLMLFLKGMHFLVVYSAFVVCWYFFYSSRDANNADLMAYSDVLLCVVIFIALLFFSNTYSVYRIAYSRKTDLIFSQVLSLLFIYCLAYFIDLIMRLKWSNPLFMLAFFGGSVVFSVLWTIIAHSAHFKIHSAKKTILLYTKESDVVRIKEAYNHAKCFNVIEMVNVKDKSLDEIVDVIKESEVIFVAGVQASIRNGLAKYCVDNGVKGFFVPHVGDIILMGGMTIQQFSTPVIAIRRAAPNPAFLLTKRLFDILMSFLGIVICSPLMLIVAIIIKCYDGGPVFYSQIRLTKDRKPFKILKFRSMRIDAEKDGKARLATEHDSRITPFGRFIRKCRLDELPQLINILKGDMTIVGPRPERPEIAEQYEKEIPAFALRLQVKAGLTGYAQIYGRYNTDPYDKMQMDLMYINKMSIIEDLKLMFATVRILFVKESTAGIDDNATTARHGESTNSSIN